MVNPLLKWAGGKRWLVNSKQLPLPENYERYFEPFVGSGAVFFHLMPKQAILADLNKDLINLYKVARDFPEALEKLMRSHHISHSSEYYYRMRSLEISDPVVAAARFLYLNRTCWNGLYRVNRFGQFNVPIGTKKNVIMDTDDFRKVSEILMHADLRHSDFQSVIDEACLGDFLFVDPPYTVQHNFNGFLKYNEQIFSWADQVRLRDSLFSASKRGVSIVLTNADHVSVKELYSIGFEYRSLSRHSVLSGATANRGRTTEAIFTCNI